MLIPAVESVRIYSVRDTSVIYDLQERLASIFADRPVDNSVRFSVSKDGGRLSFEDQRVLWRTKDRTRLPQTAMAAELAARRFIGHVNSAIQTNEGLQNLRSVGINRLFPDDIRSSVIAVVTDPNRGVVDHWLVCFDSYLPTDTSFGSVPVLGAFAEFRVGTDGAIGACWLTWRPCYPVNTLVPLIPLAETKASNFASSEAAPIPLLYCLADEGVKQIFISPYFFLQEDDGGTFVPASSYSLTVDIAFDTASENPRLIAQVVGGSGNYEYQWAISDSTDIWRAESQFGVDDGIDLDRGCYNAILKVTDRSTNAITFAERSIYTDMLGNGQ